MISIKCSVKGKENVRHPNMLNVTTHSKPFPVGRGLLEKGRTRAMLNKWLKAKQVVAGILNLMYHFEIRENCTDTH